MEAEGIVEILLTLHVIKDRERLSKMREHVFKAFFRFVVGAHSLHEEFYV